MGFIQSLSSEYRQYPERIEPRLKELLDYIRRENPKYNACLWLISDEEAEKICERLRSLPVSQRGRFFGVPVILKANISKRGFPISCASKILEGYHGLFDATVVERLEKEGAVIIGVANQDEFAMGSANTTSAMGPVLNPLDTDRVPGGSSGGSAVSCLLDFAPLTLGSDTGGSVRLPASYCGILGFCPSYGRISRYGLVAYGSSLDRIGLFAKRVEDLQETMDVIAGPDEKDLTTQPTPYGPVPSMSGDRPKRIAFVTTDLDQPDTFQHQVMNEMQNLGEKLGFKVDRIVIHQLQSILTLYYVIASSEAATNLSRFDGIRYGYSIRRNEDGELLDYRQSIGKTRAQGFGREVKLRILLGTCALSKGFHDEIYRKACTLREELKSKIHSLFQYYDYLVLPTAAGIAPKFKEKQSAKEGFMNDIYTILGSLSGLCALSWPFPWEGLPRGVQLMGAPGGDHALLSFARVLESENLIKIASKPH